MNALPARVAGVTRIVMVTPPQADGKVDPVTLAAAHIAGVHEVYALGGAQAIAALAYGTQQIEAVDKITGPGNAYVACAKQLLFGKVDIDMIAGPSEVLIIADDSPRPDWIASDLLSQAEHDQRAAVTLITTSETLGDAVIAQVEAQLETLSRKDICRQSIDEFGTVVIVPNIDLAVELANILAPEHLELLTRDPEVLVSKLTHAGAVFVGEYTPEPIGDYLAGPSHVLPTGGTARFFSALSAESFLRKSSYLSYGKEQLLASIPAAAFMAHTEGLTAHQASLERRKIDE
jgi:histidinol dehydrogenase